MQQLFHSSKALSEYIILRLVYRFHKPVQFSNWFIGIGSVFEPVLLKNSIKEIVLEPVFPKILQI